MQQPVKLDNLLDKNIGETNYLDLIIKSHLLIENKLNLILANCFPNFEKIESFTFNNKILLLEALVTIHKPDLIKAVRLLNSIRNRFAHSLNSELQDEDFEVMNNIFSLQKFKEKIQQIQKDADQIFPDVEPKINCNSLFLKKSLFQYFVETLDMCLDNLGKKIEEKFNKVNNG